MSTPRDPYAVMPGIEEEPLLADGEIQGNLAGFHTDHQAVIYLFVNDPAAARAALASVAASSTSLREVWEARQHGHSKALWRNFSIAASGIRKLLGDAWAAQVPDLAFRDGLAARSSLLGDPPGRWLVGDDHNPADAVVILGSDDAAAVDAEIARWRDEHPARGWSVVHIDRGAVRSDKPGHEHFGFRDGISHPSLRGRMASAQDRYLTPRYVAPTNEGHRFARPGQPLVWPGEFVFGYHRQDRDDLDRKAPPVEVPAWMHNGSFLVVRRLRQDVAGFWRSMTAAAAKLKANRGVSLTATELASRLVGRWPDGTSLLHSTSPPSAPPAEESVNHFGFLADAPVIELLDGPALQPVAADPLGMRCPLGAHVRKIAPRDVASEETGTVADNLRRLLLRRGIPYGSVLSDPLGATAEAAAADRGLLFLAYQTSIVDQFEFVQRRWANNPLRPEDGGHDALIGQAPAAGARTRATRIFVAGVGVVSVSLLEEWVAPTGGGYFFAPSIKTLQAWATAADDMLDVPVARR